MMEISDFAAAVLYSPALEDKLAVPDELTDADPTARARIPDRPARVPGMRFAGASERPVFPSGRAIEETHGRALALHFFANHELLALELMALALLRFDKAEPSFRMGIAHTMLEEQRHFRLYVDRIEQLGVTFGDFGLNSFFWDALSGMASPMDYVTQLSMTFEQANLDYAAHYKAMFDRLGDPATASIFQTIHDDEVGHLAYGLRWFERWRSPGADLWDAWREALPASLSPAWGRGINGVGFHEDGRREAGLPDEFIARIRTFSRSRGRPPRIFFFNPAPGDVDGGLDGSDLEALKRDLRPASAFLGRSEDVMIGDPLSLAQTHHLVSRGVMPPEFVPLPEVDALKTRGRLYGVIPWRWAPDAWARDRRLQPNLIHGVPDSSAKVLIESTLPSEPESKAALSFAWVFYVGPRAAPPVPVRPLGPPPPGVAGPLVRQRFDARGGEERRWLHEGRTGALSRFKEMSRAALRVRTHLRGAGYVGSATMHVGVNDWPESGLAWKIDGVKLGPSLDLIACELRRRVAPGCYGVWVQVDRQGLNTLELDDFAALKDAVEADLPLDLERRGSDQRLRSGVLWTSEPRRCTTRASMLVVGQSGRALRALNPALNALLGG